MTGADLIGEANEIREAKYTMQFTKDIVNSMETVDRIQLKLDRAKESLDKLKATSLEDYMKNNTIDVDPYK